AGPARGGARVVLQRPRGRAGRAWPVALPAGRDGASGPGVRRARPAVLAARTPLHPIRPAAAVVSAACIVPGDRARRASAGSSGAASMLGSWSSATRSGAPFAAPRFGPSADGAGTTPHHPLPTGAAHFDPTRV